MQCHIKCIFSEVHCHDFMIIMKHRLCIFHGYIFFYHLFFLLGLLGRRRWCWYGYVELYAKKKSAWRMNKLNHHTLKKKLLLFLLSYHHAYIYFFIHINFFFTDLTWKKKLLHFGSDWLCEGRNRVVFCEWSGERKMQFLFFCIHILLNILYIIFFIFTVYLFFLLLSLYRDSFNVLIYKKVHLYCCIFIFIFLLNKLIRYIEKKIVRRIIIIFL